jgi:hypothetical protein
LSFFALKTGMLDNCKHHDVNPKIFKKIEKSPKRLELGIGNTKKIFSRITFTTQKCKKNHTIPFEVRNMMSTSGISGSAAILKIFLINRFYCLMPVCNFSELNCD